jgi:carboxyl-terminal processing protease
MTVTHGPNMRTLVTLTAAFLIAAVLPPALHGCSGAPTGSGDAIADDPYPLSDSGADELARFQSAYALYAKDPENSRQLKQFRDAYRRVRAAYAFPVSDKKLIDAAIEGVRKDDPAPHSLASETLVKRALDSMTASLDPHSVYLDPEELQEAEMTTTGEFGGLGIQVAREDGSIKIISPIEDTPADRAGLKPGDTITHVDGKAVAGMQLSEVVRAMRGEPGTQIRLTVKREGRGSLEFAITRAVIAVRPVRWKVSDGVGYLRILNFNERTMEGLETAMEELHRQLGSSGRGIVLDLRNNPGGLFDQSLRVADAFLDDGVIVSVRGRNLSRTREFRAQDGDAAKGLPMVVLINSGSASASEIVASALQDQHRATVMGSRSFGKGSVQTVMRLPVEGALKLTTALYYSPSGRTIQAQGVQPDITLTGTDNNQGRTREADLPGSIPGSQVAYPQVQAEVDTRTCPQASGFDDYELTCAIALLDAGSVDRFVRVLAARPPG